MTDFERWERLPAYDPQDPTTFTFYDGFGAAVRGHVEAIAPLIMVEHGDDPELYLAEVLATLAGR